MESDLRLGFDNWKALMDFSHCHHCVANGFVAQADSLNCFSYQTVSGAS